MRLTEKMLQLASEVCSVLTVLCVQGGKEHTRQGPRGACVQGTKVQLCKAHAIHTTPKTGKQRRNKVKKPKKDRQQANATQRVVLDETRVVYDTRPVG